MHIGVCIFATDYAIRIDELARETEARGFESLFVPEHTHIPVSRRTPFPGGGELPKEYSHTFDPFVSLMAAAAATTRLRIGTGICLIIERDTITLAKEVASLDLLSGGRFEFGIGGGWNAEEMEHHGTVYATRFKRLEEQVRALKEIWTKDEAEFHGRHVNFDKIWSWPKPAQKPHPPVLLGGESAPHSPARGRLVRRLVPARARPRDHPARPQGSGGARGQGRPRHEDHLDLDLRGEAGGGDARDLCPGRHHAGHPAPASRGPGHRAPPSRPVGEADQAVEAGRSSSSGRGSWRSRARTP